MDYEEGIKLGLDKFEIEDLPNMDTSMIAFILEEHPGSLAFVKKVLEQNGKTLNIEELVDYLVDEIDEPYFDPDYGYEDVEGNTRVLKELGYDYEELKDAEREEDAFYINEYGEIIRPADEELDYTISQELKDEHHQEAIDPELEQWLNGGKAKTPIQQAKGEKTYDFFGSKATEKEIIEGINEDAIYYWDIIDIIRENETIRDMVLRKITSLDVTSEEYADYRKLLDEIHHIRAKELQKRDAELSSLEAEEKTISEAEALLDKQTKKEGQSIGE